MIDDGSVIIMMVAKWRFSNPIILYLYLLADILLQNSPFYLFYVIIHLCQHEFMDSYFIQWVITHCYTYLFSCSNCPIISNFNNVHLRQEFCLYITLSHYFLQQLYSSLCYTVGPCCLSILNVCIYKHQILSPSLSLPLPLGNHKSDLYVCDSVSVLQVSSFVPYFRFHI